MIRTHWMTSAASAKAYYRSSDYYATTPGQWLGRGAALLGLEGDARPEQFDALADNLDPRTGLPLTTYSRDGRRVGLDMTFNSTKSVGVARELAGVDNAGDPRIEAAHREAVAYTIGFVEKDMQARVRIGGKDEDRTTGNMVAYRVTHRDTRINADDQKPDMSLHDHVFIFNATFDAVENKWKAAQMGQIKHDAPYYEAIYHNRLASNIRELGYGVRRKGKAFEIAGVSDELVKKFSRRREFIKGWAQEHGTASAAGMDKLGAITRGGKAKDPSDDLNGYYVSRLTDQEKQQLGSLQGQRSYLSTDLDAVGFAVAHLFERRSVVDEKRLYEAALRHGIGSVTPQGVQAEAKRQGVLEKKGEATTRQVLAEEGRVIQFAREGKGVCGPLREGNRRPVEATTSLSAEQAAIVRHVWDSNDRVILIRGAAGTGKTHTMRTTIAGIDRPVVVLAPSAEASRGVLRQEGFAGADTVARFLQDEDFQRQAKNGVVWVDEAGLLGIQQVAQVFEKAKELNARVVLQGDKRQHGSVERGATLRVLEEYGGLPVAELRDIRRQRGRYKAAVEALSKGDVVDGYDKLVELGWVRRVDDDKPLVDDYLAGLDAGKQMLVVAPTHHEGDEITAHIRARLKVCGVLSGKEIVVDQLKPLGWTDAEKGDPERYDGTEVLVFHRNSGTFRAGQKVRVADWKPGDRFSSPTHFAVYTPGQLSVAAGDVLRITANGKTKDGHKLNNGAVYRVKGVRKNGDVVLANGWTLGADYGHVDHGYVSTSHAAQGKTVDRVLIAMGGESLPAVSAEQFYVSVSRGRESATVYSDLDAASLREAVQRTDVRKSATELMTPTIVAPQQRRWRGVMKKAQDRFRRLCGREVGVTKVHEHEKERGHAAYER